MSIIIATALGIWKDIRAEYELVREAAYEKAEDACNGKLLNERGRRAGIDAYSLFMGSSTRALAYASPELVEHWASFPRITYAAYERQVAPAYLAGMETA